MLLALGMDGMVPRTRLRHTRDYLPTGICSLINCWFVSLALCNITKKICDQILWNFQDKSEMIKGTSTLKMGLFWVTIWLQFFIAVTP